MTTLSALLAAAALGAQVNVGDRAPKPEPFRIFHDRISHVDDLAGKAVLYVWVLADDPGAVALLRELNRVHDRFRKRGLVVLAVSHRDEALVQRLVMQARPRFPVAWEPSNLSMGAYPFTFWPASALADARGRVVWKGAAGQVSDADIARAVRGAHIEGPDAPLQLAPDLPPALSAAMNALQDGKLDRGLDLLEKGVKTGDEEVRRAAEEARRQVIELLDWKLRAASRAEEEREYYQAELILERVRRHAPGTSWDAKAVETLTRFRKDEAIRKELRGGRALFEARDAIAEKDGKKAEKLLRPLTRRAFEGTAVQEKAAKLLEAMK